MKTSYPCSLSSIGKNALLVFTMLAYSAILNTLSAQVLPVNNSPTNSVKEEHLLSRHKTAASALNLIQLNFTGNAISDILNFSMPSSWITQEVVIDIYNANGKLIRKITEHRAAENLAVEVFDLKAGSYLLRLSCRNDIALHHTVRFATL